MLTIVNVSFPFAPINADPVGGAEQVLAQLDRALVAAGHRSIVLAPAASRVSGQLVPIPHAEPGGVLARLHAQRAMRRALDGVLARERVDVLHFHGSDFDAYLPPRGPPALVSLHLPFDWYAPSALRVRRPLTWLQPVSRHQAHGAPEGVRLLAPIENGVAENPFALVARKRNFALVLGRICPEKGFHDAIAAARAANMPLLIAGEVFAWETHRRYFDEQIAPQLDPQIRFVGALRGARKQRLLAAARCVLIPSRAPETSSLVAMEALAAGTPVIAYPSGALPEIVEHGVTGFVVDDVEAMARAITQCECLAAQACRETVQLRFPLQRMCDAYLDLYQRLAAQAPQRERAERAAVRWSPHPSPLSSRKREASAERLAGEGIQDDFVPNT